MFLPVIFNDQFSALLKCLWGATDPTPCRFTPLSHRALRLPISPTEHEHSAVCVFIHTAWLLYRLLQCKALCLNQVHKNRLSLFSLWDSSVCSLHFSPSLTKSPHLCICKCFHMKSTSLAAQLFVHLAVGVGTKPLNRFEDTPLFKCHRVASACCSPVCLLIIYKALITVVKSRAAELSCRDPSAAAATKWEEEEKTRGHCYTLMYSVSSIQTSAELQPSSITDMWLVVLTCEDNTCTCQGTSSHSVFETITTLTQRNSPQKI